LLSSWFSLSPSLFFFPPSPLTSELVPLCIAFRPCAQLDKGGMVAIGITPDLFSTSGNQPGWKSGSFGYHSNDGQLYLGAPNRSFQFPNHKRVLFGEGDVVGCGIDSELNGVYSGACV
jgi:SPRY domain